MTLRFHIIYNSISSFLPPTIPISTHIISHSMSNQYQQRPRRPRRRQSVTFNDTSQMAIVSDLSTIVDRDELWYTPDDLHASKTNQLFCKQMVKESISSKQVPPASDILGVEKFLTDQLTVEYVNRRYKLRKSVLDEARWQEARRRIRRRNSPHADHDYNYIDDMDMDTLARISSEQSIWAYDRARAAALFLQHDQEQEARLMLQQQTVDTCHDLQSRRVSPDTTPEGSSEATPCPPR